MMKTPGSWAESQPMPAVFPQPLTCQFLHNACCWAAHRLPALKQWQFLPAERNFLPEPPALWAGTRPPNRLSRENIFPRARMAIWAIQVLHYGLTLIVSFQLRF